MLERSEKAEGKRMALVGGMLIDGTGKDPLATSIVVTKDAIIEKAGRSDEVKLPAGCRVVDVSGKTVMPGMMDLHVHLSLGDEPIVPRGGIMSGLQRSLPALGISVFQRARRTLEMGFTTVRDAGDWGYATVALRDAIAAGVVEGPRILSSGQMITATGGHADLMPLWLERTDDVTNVADGVDGVLKAVRRQVKMHVDWVKFFATGGIMDAYDEQEFTDEEMATLINESHSKGRRVCTHAVQSRGMLAAVKAGVDTVEHGSYLSEQIIELMIEKGIYLVPTLYAPFSLVERGSEFGLPQAYVKKARPLLKPHFESFRMARQAGVKLALGTDAGYTPCPHGTNAFELELMVDNGMSEMECIVAATKTSAEALGLEEKVGTIEQGKWADLIVVDGNPLEEINTLQREEKIALVMKEGSICVNRLPD
jgi:imidazolonepropionase-like amidohydrolase